MQFYLNKIKIIYNDERISLSIHILIFNLHIVLYKIHINILIYYGYGFKYNVLWRHTF